MYDDADFAPCAICDRPARTRVHPGCRERLADNLTALPTLYRQLAYTLTPGRRGSDGRTGTRHAPLPCNAETLDLRARGGIEGVVGGWARDLCERERWDLPAYQSVQAVVDWACAILHANIGILCDEHEAIRELADEVRQITGQAVRITTGEKPPRRIPVACTCGNTLRVTLDTAGIRCPMCETQYGHSEALQLPIAERRAA
ncbi:hypothetical protein ACIRLA_22160 [Streptomyces sp. NPDC102364]|uniref:hypothetical protein n=1 Tax=Streptomyces sp. NPDC102364 TaxID=3366161 RepID=UPI0037FD0634